MVAANTALLGMFRMYSTLSEQAGAAIQAFTSIPQAEDLLSYCR